MDSSTQGMDRRRAPRTPVTLPTEIRYEGLDCTGYLADVSRTGAFVKTDDEEDPLFSVLRPGDWLELRLAPATGKRVVIPARVVHRRNQGIGVEFRLGQAELDTESRAFSSSGRNLPD